MSSPALLKQQLLRANKVFLLHHSTSISDLYVKSNRRKFCSLLSGFWTPFAFKWDVLLHGNPASDVYGGIKLAAGGELGIGVGEEQWGSGEREVLEDMIRDTDGLVDLTICRYGQAAAVESSFPQDDPHAHSSSESTPVWLGTTENPQAGDGLVFSGLGCIAKNSLLSLTAWTDSIYEQGEKAYGIQSRPRVSRRRRRAGLPADHHTGSQRGGSIATDTETEYESDNGKTDGEISPFSAGAIVKDKTTLAKAKGVAEKSLENATALAEKSATDERKVTAENDPAPSAWMSYLTLGYGTAWGAKRGAVSHSSSAQPTRTGSPSVSPSEVPACTDRTAANEHSSSMTDLRQVDPDPIKPSSGARFLIGLQGDLDSTKVEEHSNSAETGGKGNARLSLRTVHVELVKKEGSMSSSKQGEGQDALNSGSNTSFASSHGTKDLTEYQRLRVVVYVVGHVGYAVRQKHSLTVCSISHLSSPSYSTQAPTHYPCQLSSKSFTSTYCHFTRASACLRILPMSHLEYKMPLSNRYYIKHLPIRKIRYST